MITLSAFADEISPDPVVQLEVLAENGIRNVEFRSIDGTNVLDLGDRRHAEFRDLLRDRGFGLSAIGSPIGKIMITDAFEPHLQRFDRAIGLAEYYSCPRIRIFSFYIPAGDDPSVHRPAVIDRLRTLAKTAEMRGISLYLENEKGIYGDVPDRVLDAVLGAESPAISVAFDPANFLEVGSSIDQAWDSLKPITGHFHVKDYDVSTHKNVPAGEGQGQIPRLIADAVASGYKGFCTLEPHLVVAEKSYGFTGPERFGDAARALKSQLDSLGLLYA